MIRYCQRQKQRRSKYRDCNCYSLISLEAEYHVYPHCESDMIQESIYDAKRRSAQFSDNMDSYGNLLQRLFEIHECER